MKGGGIQNDSDFNFNMLIGRHQDRTGYFQAYANYYVTPFLENKAPGGENYVFDVGLAISF